MADFTESDVNESDVTESDVTESDVTGSDVTESDVNISVFAVQRIKMYNITEIRSLRLYYKRSEWNPVKIDYSVHTQ